MNEHFKIVCDIGGFGTFFLVAKHMGEQTTFDISANVLNVLNYNFHLKTKTAVEGSG